MRVPLRSERFQKGKGSPGQRIFRQGSERLRQQDGRRKLRLALLDRHQRTGRGRLVAKRGDARGRLLGEQTTQNQAAQLHACGSSLEYIGMARATD